MSEEDEKRDYEDFEVVINYGEMTKRVLFYDNDHRYAKLKVRLEYDGVKQSTFFRELVTAYITGDERMLDLVNDMPTKKSKARKAKSQKLRDKGQEKMKDFGLNDGEIENIFDLIAEEMPEL